MTWQISEWMVQKEISGTNHNPAWNTTIQHIESMPDPDDQAKKIIASTTIPAPLQFLTKVHQEVTKQMGTAIILQKVENLPAEHYFHCWKSMSQQEQKETFRLASITEERPQWNSIWNLMAIYERHAKRMADPQELRSTTEDSRKLARR